ALRTQQPLSLARVTEPKTSAANLALVHLHGAARTIRVPVASVRFAHVALFVAGVLRFLSHRALARRFCQTARRAPFAQTPRDPHSMDTPHPPSATNAPRSTPPSPPQTRRRCPSSSPSSSTDAKRDAARPSRAARPT